MPLPLDSRLHAVGVGAVESISNLPTKELT